MSWAIILAMALGAYAFKTVGLFALSRVTLRRPYDAVAQLLPAALFASIVVQQTFAAGHADVMLTRIAGVAVGGVAVARKAPLFVVITSAAATAALLRSIT